MTLCSRTCLVALLAVAAVRPGRAAPPAPPPARAGPAPTAGPGRASAGCQSYTITMGTRRQRVMVNGVNREIAVVVPTGAQPQRPLPLVVVWHDAGGSGGLARVYFGVEQQAPGQAIFVYPEAAAATGGKRAPWDLHPDGADVRFFDRILAEAGAELCVDLARVYSVGHGAGGDLSRLIGCRRPTALRGVAAVGGSATVACPGAPTSAAPGAAATGAPSRAVPALHIPGKDWGPAIAPKIWAFFSSLR